MTFSNRESTLAARSSDWGANPILSFGPQEGIRPSRYRPAVAGELRRRRGPRDQRLWRYRRRLAGWSTMTITARPEVFIRFTTQPHPLLTLLRHPIPPGYGQESPVAINNLGQILIGAGPRVLLTPLQQPIGRFTPSSRRSFPASPPGAGGLEVVNGRVVRVPPRDNGSGWAALPPEIRDALMGLAVNQVAGQIADPAGRGAVGRAGLELAQASVARLLASPTPAAPKSAGVRSPSSSSVSPAGRRRKRPAAKS